MGLSPVGGRAPTSQPAIGRAPSQSIPPLTGRASTESQPVVGRAPTRSGRDVDAHAHTALALPATARAATQSGAPRAQGSTVIPVPPIAVPALPVVAPTLHAMPQAPAVAHSSIPASPAAPIQIATFAAPAATPRAPIASASVVAPEPSAPANVTVSFSGLPPQIAAAIAAAPASARPLAPHLSLPPYVPAPNVGDPGEAIETVRVEKVELTELVDKYPPLPDERVAELEEVPRAFEARKLGRVLVRFAPAIGIAALVLTFVIGFLIFDGEGRHAMKTVTAPAATSEVSPKPAPAAAHGAAPATAAPSTATGDAKSNAANPATADAANSDANEKTDAASSEDKRDAGKTVATADDKPVAKPARGKIYIRSNKPAQIFLDGKSANAVTPRQLTVRPGTHKVTLWETTSGKTVTQIIEVPADKVVTVSKKFD